MKKLLLSLLCMCVVGLAEVSLQADCAPNGTVCDESTKCCNTCCGIPGLAWCCTLPLDSQIEHSGAHTKPVSSQATTKPVQKH